MPAVQTNTGLPATTQDKPRYHFDIYALVEGPQELYFGHETQVNVNVVETVRIATDEGEVEKCYISPTKRRGVERRSLIWAPVQPTGVLLGDQLGCGIPHTCAQPACPICSVYGGLITNADDVVVMGESQKRKAMTTIGRLVHGGGVAVQAQDVAEKQRAMHPSMLHKEPGEKPTPMPFKRQYNEPGLLYPIYNHCLSITETEFGVVAYAFLDALSRLGASTPKGVRLYEGHLAQDNEPFLVVDRYLVPQGKRPILSPSVMSISEALSTFRADALFVAGDTIEQNEINATHFTRWLGDSALQKLQGYASKFVDEYLMKK